MALSAGVWIDHSKAVVILISDSGKETKLIESGIKKPARAGKSARSKTPYTAHDYVAEDVLERKIIERLKHFYDLVVDCIRDAEAILILGPGEAKGELKKRIKIKKLKGRLAELETADQMADRQIAAKVQRHFRSHPEIGDEAGPLQKRLKK